MLLASTVDVTVAVEGIMVAETVIIMLIIVMEKHLAMIQTLKLSPPRQMKNPKLPKLLMIGRRRKL